MVVHNLVCSSTLDHCLLATPHSVNYDVEDGGEVVAIISETTVKIHPYSPSPRQ